PALQRLRWSPTLLADTPGEALSRMFVLPSSHYDDPEFSWRWAVAPAGIGFAGAGLGPEHVGDLFVGEARTFLDGGYLFEFKFDAGRQHFAFSDPRLADKVDDNDYKFDEGESESLVAGKNFGIVTNIVTGPDGNLYVTSLSNGAVYRISHKAIPPGIPPVIPPVVVIPPTAQLIGRTLVVDLGSGNNVLRLVLDRSGRRVLVVVNGQVLGAFRPRALVVLGGPGGNLLVVDPRLKVPALVRGGPGSTLLLN